MKPVLTNFFSLWHRQCSTLGPLLENGLKSIKRLVFDEGHRRRTLANIVLNVQLIAIGLQLALASVFVYQCTRLWSIRRSIKEAFCQLGNDEVRHEFELIELKIEKLQRIADDIELLIDQYEQCEDQYKMDKLGDQIGHKFFTIQGSGYSDVSEMICKY